MSVKIMGWIFDLDMSAGSKLVALAYADHADHDGKNIYPAIDTVARKTGLSRRQVIRITHWLEDTEFLVNDGSGPMRTNKWHINLEWRGVTPCHRDTMSRVTSDALEGDICDKSLGDTMSPESLTVINHNDIDIGINQNNWVALLIELKSRMHKNGSVNYHNYFEPTYLLAINDHTYTVAVQDEAHRAWLEDNGKATIERAIAGFTGEKTYVEFRVVDQCKTQ